MRITNSSTRSSFGRVAGVSGHYGPAPDVELRSCRLLILPQPGCGSGYLGLHLLAKTQEGVFNVLGVTSNERMEWVTVPILAHQGIGAMIVFVLLGLWAGRRHLRGVVRSAIRGTAAYHATGSATGARRAGGDREVEEILSYRTALLLILGGMVVMWWWLWRSGMPPWAAGLMVFMALIIFIGVTLWSRRGASLSRGHR